MSFIVYKTINLLNGRFYVGVHGTKNAEIFDGYFGSGDLIKTALNKYGKENFLRETLVDCGDDEIEAYSIELMLVKTVKEDPRSYNLRKGGGSWFNARKNFTKETRVQISRAGGNKLSELGKTVFQICTKEDRLRYAKKSNETKAKRGTCLFRNIEWQRENSKRTDHSGAKGTKKFNNGIEVLTFKPTDRFDENLTKNELEQFLLQHPGFTRGGKKQLNKISN